MGGGQIMSRRICDVLSTNYACSVVLADEPTGSLDKKNRDIVMRLLHELNEEGKMVIIVTHDHHQLQPGQLAGAGHVEKRDHHRLQGRKPQRGGLNAKGEGNREITKGDGQPMACLLYTSCFWAIWARARASSRAASRAGWASRAM